MADADRFFISEMDGELVGVVRLALEEGALVLRGMRVRADMQRRGIGTRLLADVVAALGSQKCYCIPYRWLISFYAQAGFVEVARDEVPPFLAVGMTSTVLTDWMSCHRDIWMVSRHRSRLVSSGRDWFSCGAGYGPSLRLALWCCSRLLLRIERFASRDIASN